MDQATLTVNLRLTNYVIRWLGRALAYSEGEVKGVVLAGFGELRNSFFFWGCVGEVLAGRVSTFCYAEAVLLIFRVSTLGRALAVLSHSEAVPSARAGPHPPKSTWQTPGPSRARLGVLIPGM